ncbi:hypothetical protein BC940DRAFT_343206 [Gongronella butleri]|nr:hypothetical protein BC940DRAFT_343206 [Gongronella butleri]
MEATTTNKDGVPTTVNDASTVNANATTSGDPVVADDKTGAGATTNEIAASSSAMEPPQVTSTPTDAATSNNSAPSTTQSTAAATAAPAAPTTATLAENATPAAAIASADTTVRNQRLVEEFQYLLEKSQSLFSGLRDLPPTGNYRQWRHYFEKTFEVYTNLWKFQQTHRALLEDKANYGLKRWEVGEIASKIGQLYYHYYLRTSETNYLHEAYVFYEAIHDRQYFKNVLEVKNPALMIKKMRYYARFIVVCLLLNKEEHLKLLVSELELLIEEYSKIFKAADSKEWHMVLEEISSFMEAERKLIPINTDRHQVPIHDHRLPVHFVSPIGAAAANLPPLRLQEVILVGGNYPHEIKFSELTLDMYRMLQSLEREPLPAHPGPTSATATATGGDGANEGPNQDPVASETPQAASMFAGDRKDLHNPHKSLLYRATLNQLMVYLATAFKDTDPHAAMLLYVSSPGYTNDPSRGFGVTGGVTMYQKKTSASAAATATVAAMTLSSAVAAANTTQTSTSTTANTANAAAQAATNASTAATSNNPSSVSAANPGNAANAASVASSGSPAIASAPASAATSPATHDAPAANVPSASNAPGTNTPASTSSPLGVQATTAAAASAAAKKLTSSAAATTTSSASSPLPATTAASTAGGAVGAATNAPSASAQIATTSSTTAGGGPSSAMMKMAPPAAQACLYPADLIPWTRKPLFLVIDSDNSTAFYQAIPNVFDQPLLALLSPTQYPSTIQDKTEIGSLFTLFLHTPLLGFCSVADIGNLDHDKWLLCVQKVAQLEHTIGQRLAENPDLDPSIMRFMQDAYLWTFIVRFVLCGVILRCHSSFKHEKSYPSSSPDMPEAIYVDKSIMTLFNELIAIAGVSTYFHLPVSTPTSATAPVPSSNLENI